MVLFRSLYESKMFKLVVATSVLFVTFLSAGIFVENASAHGYVDIPKSRAYLCKIQVNTDCGEAQYNAHNFEALKGWPAAGPIDGQIASASGRYPKLDEQSSTRWSKVEVTSGTTTFRWSLSAAHSTASWKYYMTKQNWNQNASLSRNSFDLVPFCDLPYSGQPPTTFSHTCNIPARTGYQVILAVWEVADTANAFYNVIDVNFGAPADIEAPTNPSNLAVTNTTSSSVSLSWTASQDNVAVDEYWIYRGGVKVGFVGGTTTTFKDIGLTPTTTYQYKVAARDAAGNQSGDSNSISGTTTIVVPDPIAPTAPLNLHDMGVSTNNLTLMWGASTDNVGVHAYRVYKDGALLTTVSGTTLSYNVTGLTPGTAYNFTVFAVDEAGNVSPSSNTHSVTTLSTVCPAPWSSTQTYLNGDQVTYNGIKYQAKWWTQNERPDLKSGQWDVWLSLGSCT